MTAVLILLAVAGVTAAAGYLVWRGRPRGQLTPPLPKAVTTSELFGGTPVVQPEAKEIPASVHPVLDFDGPPGRVAVSKPTMIIGRHSQDDIRVADIRMSRHHARLIFRPDECFELDNLTAIRSEPNPMLVNGVEKANAVLEDGDSISLGGVTFKFRRNDRSQATG